MRKILISILLAGAAASPALAQDAGDRWHHGDGKPAREDRQQAHEDRQQAHEERQQAREERQQAAPERAAPQFQAPQQRSGPQFEQRQQVQEGAHGFDRSRFEGRNNGAAQVEAQQQYVARQQQQQWRGRNGFDGSQAEARQQGQAYQGQRYDGQRYQGQRYQGQAYQQGQVYQGQRYQGQSYQGQTYQRRYQGQQSATNWNRNWRNDQRYNWRNYREHHRSTFHLGIYYDPFGYGYRQFDIGYRLFPGYFGQQYWIDPQMYELPYPPPGTQWIRYWNDAVLVDMYSGEVVDVIRDFFW